jgi:hypothetical protein
MPKQTEAQFERAIVEYAELQGWLSYHTYDSRRSGEGFPDRVFVRGPRLIFAELKSEKGRVSRAQQKWRDALTVVVEEAEQRADSIDGEWYGGRGHIQTHIEAHLWRPQDWPKIEATLRR